MPTIRYEKQDNIGIITINRPEALNALNTAVFNELEPLVGEIERDATLAALIITGEGRSFVAGADIGEQCPMDLEAGRKWAPSLIRFHKTADDPKCRRLSAAGRTKQRNKLISLDLEIQIINNRLPIE